MAHFRMKPHTVPQSAHAKWGVFSKDELENATSSHGLTFDFDISETGYAAKDVTIAVIAIVDGVFKYLDLTQFPKTSWVPYPDGPDAKLSKEMVITLNQLPNQKLPVSGCITGRVYFSFGSTTLVDIDSFPTSGPLTGKTNRAIYDKIEFHGGGKNGESPAYVNLKQDEFFGLSFTIKALAMGQQGESTLGFTTSRAEILESFLETKGTSDTLPAAMEGGQAGYNAHLPIYNIDGILMRIMAPSSCAASDLGENKEMQLYCNQISHFWDKYVAECFTAKRTFSFLGADMITIHYGVVADDGMSLTLYKDEAHSQVLCSLPRPANIGKDAFTYWHKTNGDLVDWGFVLMTNAGNAYGSPKTSDPSDVPKAITAAMAITASICRGVFHLDDGNLWRNVSKFYKGSDDEKGADETEFPVFTYAKVLHDNAVDNKATAFTHDNDVYVNRTEIHLQGSQISMPSVNVTFHGQIDVKKPN